MNLIRLTAPDDASTARTTTVAMASASTRSGRVTGLVFTRTCKRIVKAGAFGSHKITPARATAIQSAIPVMADATAIELSTRSENALTVKYAEVKGFRRACLAMGPA